MPVLILLLLHACMRFAWRRVDCASVACAIQYEYQASQTTAYGNGAIANEHLHAAWGTYRNVPLGVRSRRVSRHTHTPSDTFSSHTKPPNVMGV
jgi:hypothetical protein